MSESMSAPELRRRLDDVPLPKLSMARADLPERKILSRKPVEMTPQQVSAVVYDMAAIRFGLKNLAIAHILKEAGCPASESLISKWRNPNYTESPSMMQLCAHGVEFQRLLQKEWSKFHGFGRLALLDAVTALGELAEALEA